MLSVIFFIFHPVLPPLKGYLDRNPEFYTTTLNEYAMIPARVPITNVSITGTLIRLRSHVANARQGVAILPRPSMNKSTTLVAMHRAIESESRHESTTTPPNVANIRKHAHPLSIGSLALMTYVGVV